MKKAKVKFIIMLTMMILSLGITFKVMALQSPNLMLSGRDVYKRQPYNTD